MAEVSPALPETLPHRRLSTGSNVPPFAAASGVAELTASTASTLTYQRLRVSQKPSLEMLHLTAPGTR